VGTDTKSRVAGRPKCGEEDRDVIRDLKIRCRVGPARVSSRWWWWWEEEEEEEEERVSSKDLKR